MFGLQLRKKVVHLKEVEVVFDQKPVEGGPVQPQQLLES
jgi:hypothetical protein